MWVSSLVADLLTITQTYVLQYILAWMQIHKQCWKPGKGEKQKEFQIETVILQS